MRRLIEDDGAIENAGIAAKSGLPHGVGEDYHVVCAADLIGVGREIATKQRLHAQDVIGSDPLGVLTVGDPHREPELVQL